jgi:hypothetical protein
MFVIDDSNLVTPGSPNPDADLSPTQLNTFIRNKIWNNGSAQWVFFEYGDETTQEWADYQSSLPAPGQLLEMAREMSDADKAEIRAILQIP